LSNWRLVLPRPAQLLLEFQVLSLNCWFKYLVV